MVKSGLKNRTWDEGMEREEGGRFMMKEKMRVFIALDGRSSIRWKTY
jgi:hypothetical protein